MELFRTADGRDLEYVEVGDPGGQLVVHLHGTPGTAGSVRLLADAAHRKGVRLVAVSRPGYGRSTTTPPGLLSVARDVGELAGWLGVDEFAVLGTSGGGPFALATAAALPARVHRVLVAAGPGPVHLLAPQHLEPDDVLALERLAAGDVDGAVALVTAEAQRDFDPWRQLPDGGFEEALDQMAPPSEHYFDTRPERRAEFVADFRRSLERYDGFVRDNLSWLGSWDFDLADVVSPVLLCYGDADAMVPATNGEWLAGQLPTATLAVQPDADHGEITFGSGDYLFAALQN
ncbi:alpha/beta fold hydrolase [Nocardioides sp. HB32]